MSSPRVIRHMKAADTAACAQVAIFAPDPWRAEDFTAELSLPGHFTLLAEEAKTVVGFACFSHSEASSDLLMMAVLDRKSTRLNSSH